MFFKHDDKINKKAVNMAYFITFVFWGIVLLVNSVFEQFFDKQLISSSFTILIMGLSIFFITEFIVSRLKKS
ncbi:glucose uptake protein GlcU [Bacillus ectoiniformans]|uniref:hypothetical protein n=1 Tax=Bacillus ectoiniformans TaxID=1494429 RepID=UPI001956016E|nr:hypothetical protein [Bacillus ectoiniformans]MBM7649935.1 glucose uptake protein GlcU [Bacillus ectoiniformans]